SYWLLVGLLVACNVMDKYQCAIIFIAIFIFMLYNALARRKLLVPGPYIAVAFAVILVIPHFYYSSLHGFPEIQYALYSTVSEVSWSARIRDPFQMTLNQLGTIAPMFLMLLAFIGSRAQKFSAEYTTPYKKQYLFFMALGCFLVTITFGFLTGSKMNNNWFVPYFPMIGIALVYVIRPKVTAKRFKIFIGLLAFTMIALPASRFIAIAVNPYKLGYPNSNAYFPAESIAAKVQEEWKINNKQNMPLDYVAGDHYVAAYMTTYIPHHPVPFLDWSLEESPWVNIDNMMKQGAMFVWMAKDNPHVVNSRVDSNTLPEHVLKCFPNVKSLGIFDFKPASIANLPPSVRVGMAYLPPSNLKSPCADDEFTGNDY
ncbi:glycosyltransferase family 39 protein, partial [Francisellaceae bacterium]|nr:glycosyltransferase family 39 protein [Francisellaceae bacterium]